MESIDQVTERLSARIIETVNVAKRLEASQEATKIEIATILENSIQWYIQDVLKLIKNINETSYNASDRGQRLIDMEDKYGISKTHIF